MAHNPIPYIANALRTAVEDLALGIVALKPKSWRREITYWAALYAFAALIFRLPPLG